ncbi:MAG: hypothetical protein AAFP20_25420 [Cyanobacteria bacterium J06614_10]
MNKLLLHALESGLKNGLKSGLKTGLTLSSLWLGLSTAAQALPGQTMNEAEAWMQAHPTLRAHPSERLSIRRSETPSQRYTFHGSVFAPSGTSNQSLLIRRQSGEALVVHSEKFTLVDIVRGVSVPRLEDALRSIYGAEVFADYRRAQTLVVYSPDRAEERGTAIATRSHLLEGDLYGYLIEVLPDDNGNEQTGSVTVMLRENLPAIQEGIRARAYQLQEAENPDGRSVIRANGVSLRDLLENVDENIDENIEN